MADTPTKEKVRDLLNKGLTVLEVARHLNISPQAVYKHLHKLELELPTQKESA